MVCTRDIVLLDNVKGGTLRRENKSSGKILGYEIAMSRSKAFRGEIYMPWVNHSGNDTE